MISFGCNILSTRLYEKDVAFALSNKFDFFQIGYTSEGFPYMNVQDAPYPETLQKNKYPIIIHALLRVSEFNEHLPILLQVLKYLGCRILIIHPLSQTREPGSTHISELIEGMHSALALFSPHGISLYIENNGAIDTLFSSIEDIKAMFAIHPDLEFLLDIAHARDYDTLCRMVDVRMPKALHIADRRDAIAHEHLPIGEGNIDFGRIMAGPLARFKGKVIFEVPTNDRDRLAALEQALCWWPPSICQ